MKKEQKKIFKELIASHIKLHTGTDIEFFDDKVRIISGKPSIKINTKEKTNVFSREYHQLLRVCDSSKIINRIYQDGFKVLLIEVNEDWQDHIKVEGE